MVFELEKEALIASGVRRKDRVGDYLRKLDSIEKLFISKNDINSTQKTRAERLFDALWKDRPNRYRQRGTFRLNEVIDSQLSKKSLTVGNCLGLTVLYNSLLKRIGLIPKALYLENAFGIGAHVLTLLIIDNLAIDIENILPTGFDYQGHKQDSTRVIWDDKDLVADIYNSIGTECFQRGDFTEALINYDMALKLNPAYERAVINRAILLEKMKTDK